MPIDDGPAASSGKWLPVVFALATALSLATGFLVRDLVLKSSPPANQPLAAAASQSGWGWAGENAFPRTGSPAEYLRELAAGAKAWANKKPQTKAELVKRLGEFRIGCSMLLMAEHEPLQGVTDDRGQETRQWLRQSCNRWAEEVVKLWNALESDNRKLQNVQAQADGLAKTIAVELEKKAEELERPQPQA